jgi:LmbE family N-acetylglucosaminyl deacetylase
MHRQWQLPADQAVRRRVHEDVEALETLGADAYLLPQLDAIYRMPASYTDDATLFGAVHPADPLAAALREQAAALAARYPAAIFYAPLGVGQHVDHQAAYAVARELAGGGLSVAFYEDFPYVADPGALDRRMEALGGRASFVAGVTDIDATLARKISAIESYGSQISTLFGTSAAMAERVRAYAEELRPEQGTYGERIWIRR